MKISIFPRENQYFLGFRQNDFFYSAMRFCIKNPAKKAYKTKPKRRKKQDRKRLAF